MSDAPKPNGQFAVCVATGAYSASLERWKIYRVIADPDATEHGQLRVVDESGEDYVFPEEYFSLIDLPPRLERLYLEQPHT